MLGLRYSAVARKLSGSSDILAIRPDVALPAASIVKLLIAIALIEVTGVLTESLETLLRRMIQHSDNDAANTIVNLLTIQVINGVAARLGLAVTRLHGLFISSPVSIKPRTFTTARECITMLSHILRQRQAQSMQVARSYGLLLDAMTAQDDRRFFPAAAPSGTVIANKTGEIHGELNDAAIVDPYGTDPLLLSLFAHGTFDIYKQPYLYHDAVTEVSALAKCVFDEAIRA